MKTLMISLLTITALTACAGREEFCPAEEVITWGSASPEQDNLEFLEMEKAKETK